MNADRKIKVHVKNNHASPDSFPSTPESEPVFTTTQERWEAALARHPDPATTVVTVPGTGVGGAEADAFGLLHGKTAVEGRATAYVCRGTSCTLPVVEPAALQRLGADAG